MTQIKSRAAARREKARRQNGRFGEQEFDPADNIDLPGTAPVPLTEEVPPGRSIAYSDFEVPQLGVATHLIAEHTADGTLSTHLEAAVDLEVTGPDGTVRDGQWFADRVGVFRAFAAARGAHHTTDPSEDDLYSVQFQTPRQDAGDLTTADLAGVADRADPDRMLRDRSGNDELEAYLRDVDDVVDFASRRAVASWEADQVAEFNTVLALDSTDDAELEQRSIEEDDILPGSADQVTRVARQFLRDRWDTIDVVAAERRAAGLDAATREQIATFATETYLHGRLAYGREALDATPTGRALMDDAADDSTWKNRTVAWDGDAGGYVYARREDVLP